MQTVSFSKLGQYGRLANSMFQIAATIAHAKKYGYEFSLPTWQYSKYFKFDSIYDNASIPVDGIYNEPTFHYTPIPEFTRNTDLLGYFQSPLHFSNINVQELFELKSQYQQQISNLYEKYNPNNLHTCSIHVRRGDYLKEPHLSYHGVLGMHYYDEAGNQLYHRFNQNLKILYLVFSDDIAWCKTQFLHPNVVFIEGNTDIIDLFLMARCNDNIIANSSFSYWAAYLNKNKNKAVIAPKQWFADANLNTNDLIPEQWITV